MKGTEVIQNKVFKQRKNKKFNYQTRFQNSEAEERFEDFESKWAEVRPRKKRRGSVLTSLPMMIVFLIAVLVLMYVLNGYTK